ncbi:MAG: ATP-binding cassette domain-containing protein [Actinobacteria bacterium]|uniref:Unannotated protein n=1 Tax=freshwater metagenome TaxID=449393 RepID=A0A6J5YPE8_9ZZZZ|nr:ATP-binding cassette domain-containing protein [Actinomycetota bacterium]
MSFINLNNVNVEYQIMGSRDLNLKRAVIGRITRNLPAPTTVEALKNITLNLAEGDRLGIVGPNGSGKSTLLAVLSGLLPPFSGTILRQGRTLSLLGGANSGLEPEDTGRQNIISVGIRLGETSKVMKALVDEITDFSELGERISHPIYTYSSGMAARLRFSILTSLRPEILIIDEGIAAADNEFAHKAQERLQAFMQSAGILVLATHNEAMIDSFCNRTISMLHGEVLADRPHERREQA